MYRYGLLLGLLIFSLAGTAAAAAGEDDQGEKGEILLVWGEAGEDELSFLSETASALTKAMDFGSVSWSTGKLEQYDHVICFQVTKPTEEFTEELAGYQGELMIVGSSLMERYLEASGQEALLLSQETQTRGVLNYRFSGGEAFWEVTETQDLCLFQGEGYESGQVNIQDLTVPFCQEIGGVRFLPVTDYEGALAKAAFTQELAQWLWPYQDAMPDYAQYLVLDEVYPFMDPQTLKDEIDLMIQSNLTFVISAMPITRNADYPAMKEFCQVLSYAQANGGAVILRAPIVHKTSPALEELQSELTEMTLAYIENGVYPLGIQVPYSWTNDETYLELLKRYTTVFVYEDGKAHGFQEDAHENLIYYNYHQLILPAYELDDTKRSYLSCYPAAAYCNAADTTLTELWEIADHFKDSAVPLKSLWDMDHNVWINDHSLLYQDRILKLDNETVTVEFTPVAFDEAYDYGRDVLYRATVELQNENRGLIVLVAVITVLFLSFIGYARYRNRKHFLKKEQKDGKSKGGGS